MFGFRHGRQKQRRHLAVLAKIRQEFKPGFTRHHDVDDQKVKGDAAKKAPRISGRRDIGDPKAAFLQEPAKQQPQPLVIVDHKDVLKFFVLDVIHHVTGTCTTSPAMRAAG